MSGRLVSNSDGRPGAILSTIPWEVSGSGAGSGDADRPADQEFERVAGLGALQLEIGALGLRLRQQGLDRAIVERGSDPGVEPLLADLQRAGAAVNGVFGDGDARVELALDEIGVGDVGDQADLERALGMDRRQIIGARGLGQAAHPAPEIELERGDAGADLEAVAGDRRNAVTACDARPAGAGGGVDVRHLVGAPDAILAARLVDPQDRGAQVAIIVERGRDQRLQARVAEEAAPLDVRRARARGGRAGISRILRRGRQARLDIFGLHRAAGEEQRQRTGRSA